MAMNTGNVNLKTLGEKMNEWYPQANAQVPQTAAEQNFQMKAQAQDQILGVTRGLVPRLPSLLDEAEAEAKRHSEQAARQERAAEFFRAHPEFDEFIQLVRQGVIGI